MRQLDPDEEASLAHAWRAGDTDAARRLVEANLPFVVRVAHQYRRWGVPFEDLVQQGSIGLLKAAEKFEAGRECRLTTYAAYWIRAEMADYLVRSYRIVRLGSTYTERRAIRAFRQVEIETPEELAATSGMPVERARKLLPVLAMRDLSLDGSSFDRAPAVERFRSSSPTPEEEASRRDEARQVRARLGAALEKLSERERRILEARLFSDAPVTLAVLALEMRVSKERVRQLESRALSKLREELADLRPAA